MSKEQQSIRPFLEALEKSGSLLRIPKTVDPAFSKLSAFLSAADAGPALLFEKGPWDRRCASPETS